MVAVRIYVFNGPKRGPFLQRKSGSPKPTQFFTPMRIFNKWDRLWLLASNAGRVLSREEIFSALRGIEYDGQDRSIDVRVSRIRPKIGDDPIHPKRIKTVRSKGYLFVKEA